MPRRWWGRSHRSGDGAHCAADQRADRRSLAAGGRTTDGGPGSSPDQATTGCPLCGIVGIACAQREAGADRQRTGRDQTFHRTLLTFGTNRREPLATKLQLPQPTARSAHSPSAAIEAKFNLPTRRNVDMSLIGGAALFGVGWGLAGVCPGPALTDLARLDAKVLLFVVAMLIGVVATKTWQKRVTVMKAMRPVLTQPS
jgi:hypothetical protein